MDDSSSLQIISSYTQVDSSSSGALDISLETSLSAHTLPRITPSASVDVSSLQPIVTPSVVITPSATVDVLSLQPIVTPSVVITSSATVDVSSLQPIVTPSVVWQSLSSSTTISTRPPVCTCSCKITRTVTDVSSKIDEIQRNLTVKKKNLSSRRRKQHTAVDDRSSSLTIGLFGIVFLSLTFIVITISDVVQAIHYLLSNFNSDRSFRLAKKCF